MATSPAAAFRSQRIRLKYVLFVGLGLMSRFAPRPERDARLPLPVHSILHHLMTLFADRRHFLWHWHGECFPWT